jgi:hypothetical protein
MLIQDVGPHFITLLYQRMKVDDCWSVREARGFTWWAGSLAQHIWVDPPAGDDDLSVCRIHVMTELITEYEDSEKHQDVLATMARFATLSSVVRDTKVPNRLCLYASAICHQQNYTWLESTIAWVALLQNAEAHRFVFVWHCYKVLGAEPAITSHPTSGKRLADDELLDLTLQVVAPDGAKPSRWVGNEMVEARGIVQQHPSCGLATGDETEMRAGFPFGDETAVLQVIGEVNQPQMGHGMLILLKLPLGGEDAATKSMALGLNQLESEERIGYSFGSWCATESGLTHTTFFPNSLYYPGLLTNLVLYEVHRLDWVAEQMGLSF